jgi:hypothetical protein
MAAESDALDFLRANFARVHERLDRIETRLGQLTTRVAAIERDLAAMKVDYAATRCASTIWIAGSSASRKQLSLIEA